MKQNLKYLLVLIGLVIISLMIMDFNQRINELGRLAEQRDLVAGQVTQLNVTNVQLQTQIAYATSESAVRERAYGQERMVGPGDVLVVPLPAGEVTPTPTPMPSETRSVYENWQYWYALFFEARP
jgi:hypothetical protein